MSIEPRLGPMRRRWLAALALFSGLTAFSTDLLAEPNYGTQPKVIDVGYGVLATPMSVLGEVMRRDRLLHDAAQAQGLEFRFHAFEKGVDSLEPLMEDKLDAAMPTDVVALEAIAKGDAVLLGYVRQSFSAVVGPRHATMASLRGKRIGNAPGTSGHNTLVQGLASVGLGEKDVTLVNMNVRDMPEALAAGQIDAFAAFEPTPALVLRKFPTRYATLYRQISPAYFVVNRKLLLRDPEAARLLIASLHRSVRWLHRKRENLSQASQWTVAAMEAFTGKAANLSDKEIAGLTRSDLLEVPGAPLIPAREAEPGSHLYKTYEYQKKTGRLPANFAWPWVQRSIDREFTQSVLGNARKYRLDDYQAQP